MSSRNLVFVFSLLSWPGLGFFLGSPPDSNPLTTLRFYATITGIALVGAACGSLNMYLEKEVDGRMWRTMKRPLPSGRLTPKSVLVLGFFFAILGEGILLFLVNPVTTVLGGLALFIYLGVYTPSKKISALSTLIGAIPGAMPPLMGWTGAKGMVTGFGFWLFALLFLWQIPHFLSLAWIYREDYERGGLPILSVIDKEGRMMAQQVIIYTIALLPLTLIPSVWGTAGQVYLVGALVLGFIYIFLGVRWAVLRSMAHARQLFIYSILYLPALAFLLVKDRVL